MNDLTPLEERLVRSVESGRVLDLTNGEYNTSKDQMRAWGPDRTVRASVIRDILRGQLASDSDPRGVNLRGARIGGHLDLRHLTIRVPVNLWTCYLASGANLSWATLKSFDIRRSHIRTLDLQDAHVGGPVIVSGTTISNDRGPALVADGLKVDNDLVLDHGFTATGVGKGGAVRLIGARIGGDLGGSGATIGNGSGPALFADRLQVDGSLFLTGGSTFTGAGDDGAIRLVGARVGGNLVVSDAVITNQTGSGMVADGIQANSLFMQRLAATGAGDKGAVRLLDARLRGGLEAAGATVINESGPSLYADRLQSGGTLFLHDRFNATGTVRLHGAHVGGQLDATGASIINKTGMAVFADALKVDGDLILSDGFTAVGTGEGGAVRLDGARISGELDAADARISNETGPALSAEHLQVNGVASLTGLTATGAGQNGAVLLLQARFRDELDARGATIINQSGPAVNADRLEAGTLALNNFSATGAGESGSVRLSGAHVSAQLDASGATIINETGVGLFADRLQVDSDVFLCDGFRVVSSSEYVTISLTDSRLGGLYIDLTGIEDATGSTGTLDVSGLVYGGLPIGPTAADWLAVLAYRTPDYSSQPYQQLAAATRAAGHDGDTRKVLMAQRRDQIRRRAVTAFPERTWARATGILLGYGYQPWRAVLYLLAVLAAAVGVAITIGGHHGGLAHPAGTAPPSGACTIVEQIGVGIDLGLPIIKSGVREGCTTTPTTAGQTIVVAGWVLQLLAWGLATLFVAGFTGAVRKT